ncbi:MAG: two-component system response regulator [Gammaproteobacteria bacterium]|nr:MAG: two-component system response regulator [Gammaproteobacteria bacterium]
MNVLFVEDNHDLAETVCEYLELEGIVCYHALNGERGLVLALENRYQVIMLDLNLPRLDGLSLCKKLREKGDDTPILMLTARDSLESKVDGFRAGADDYLVKPFALEELLARLRALAKRRSGQIKKLCCEDLQMDMMAKVVTRAKQPLKITPILWKLLETLLRASPNVVPRCELEDAVWGDDLPASNSLKVQMHHLRRVVDAPFEEKLIHTISRHGFAIYKEDDKADDD